MSLNHIAIIPDGNGRWAKNKNVSKAEGHAKGAETAQHIIEVAAQNGVRHLTLYGFSSENWNREPSEVDDLMSLMFSYLTERAEELNKNNIKLKIIGNREKLSQEMKDAVENAEKLTSQNDLMILYIAISYGGKDEITRAAKKIAAQNIAPGDIDEALIARNLDDPDMPDVDLVIRTSGEKRISNFLIWQIAYSELYFSEALWPDFSEEEFLKAIEDFNNRKRNFGYTRNEDN